MASSILSSRTISVGALSLASPHRSQDTHFSAWHLAGFGREEKSKRAAERKAAKRAETKALMSKPKGADEDDNDAKAEAAPSGPVPYESTDTVMQSLTICGSYKDKDGRKALGRHPSWCRKPPEALFKAPFVCASHDADDVFNYGNQAALSLWGLSWEEFVGKYALDQVRLCDDEACSPSDRATGPGSGERRHQELLPA